eukprot:1118082-Prymnesium_polylepis.1
MSILQLMSLAYVPVVVLMSTGRHGMFGGDGGGLGGAAAPHLPFAPSSESPTLTSAVPADVSISQTWIVLPE